MEQRSNVVGIRRLEAVELDDDLQELRTVRVSSETARVISILSREIATLGGPDATGAQSLSAAVAHTVYATLDAEQASIIDAYRRGEIAAVVFEDLDPLDDDLVPDVLPPHDTLQADTGTIQLAARSQLLLSLVAQRAFAYDIENAGKVVRLVADFTSRHATERSVHPTPEVSRSSHSGANLGAHTEGPYFSTQRVVGTHSPAPSSLILTARWNPAEEPTAIMPLSPLLEALNGAEALALSRPTFHFSVSDSYPEGTDTPENVPLLDFSPEGVPFIRMNMHRARPSHGAPSSSRRAFSKFSKAIATAVTTKITLNPRKTLLINNRQCMHGRDAIEDGRRLLIRLFGYDLGVRAVAVQSDPLVVRG